LHQPAAPLVVAADVLGSCVVHGLRSGAILHCRP
jgi:hypothetical protein